MQVRILTEEGLKQVRQFLEENPHRPTPSHLLEQNKVSAPVSGAPDIEDREFQNRYEFGRYLYEMLNAFVEEGRSRDVGLWTWLSLFYFDQICPLRNGRRKLSRINYYILEPHVWKRYYHHLVRTPYSLVKLHGRYAECLLSQPLHHSGEIIEQFASRQDIIAGKALIQAIYELYFERDEAGKGRTKRGAAGKNTPGTFRRFAEVRGQFELTYDFYSMNPEDILELMPSEFDRFRKSESEAA